MSKSMSQALNVPTWNDAFCIGSEMVDTQHRRLFEMLALLVEAERGNCDPSVIDHAVNSMYGYVRFHFNDEEQLMEELNYADRDRHRHLHDCFILAFDDLVSAKRDTESFLPSLIQFIQSWLLNHIMHEDTKICAS